MKEERDELTKFIFPQLKALCEERRVVWGEVDLRWGITDEQKAEGHVLPICLNEIRECQPYFIGILGERYGWIPDEIDNELVAREPWLKENLNHSVTELEIIHGVLKNPEMARHAFFYFRDKSYIESIEDETEKAKFFELPTDEEIQKHGRNLAEELAKSRREKLIALKEKIRQSGLPVRENYFSPKEIGQLVLKDLTNVIDLNFPVANIPDPSESENILHESYAENFSHVYIPRENYYSILDAHVFSNHPPMVISGESGIGKTALLANWTLYFRNKYRDQKIITHFIGSSKISTNWILVLMRLMGELRKISGFEIEIPTDPEKLKTAFANFLSICASHHNLIIVLDALNQLEDRERGLELHWLPDLIPTNIRFIVSCNEGKTLEILNQRNWCKLHISALNYQEKSMLIRNYLAQYTKILDDQISKDIIEHPATGNPLFLVVLLEELRIYGEHETLSEKVRYYLRSDTVESLYEKLLERYENDYEPGRSFLVRDALTLIYSSRMGLSEQELLELIGTENNPFPKRCWLELFYGMRRSIVIKSGLMSLSNQYFINAIEKRYLPLQTERVRIHLKIATYFDKQKINYRKIEEQPWHLMAAKQWPLLVELFKNVGFLSASWASNKYETKGYWAQIERNSSFRMNEVYKDYLNHDLKFPWQDYWDVAMLLSEASYHREALRIIELLITIPEEEENQTLYLQCLKNKGHSLHALGRYSDALELYLKIGRISSDLKDKVMYSDNLGDIANMLVLLGRSNEAIHHFQKQVDIYISLEMKSKLAGALNNLAVALYGMGNWDEALAIYKEVETLCLNIGEKQIYMSAIGNLGLILKNKGELTKAVDMFKKEELLASELGDMVHITAAMNNRALVLIMLNQLTEAMLVLKQTEKIARQKNDYSLMHKSIGNQAIIFNCQKRYSEALFLLKEEEQLCRRLNAKSDLATCLYNQALIISNLHRDKEVEKLLEEAKRLHIETSDLNGLQLVLGEEAELLYKHRKYHEALELLDQKEKIVEQLGFKESLAVTWVKKAVNLVELGRLNDAGILIEGACKIADEYGFNSRKEVFNNYRMIIDFMINKTNNPDNTNQ